MVTYLALVLIFILLNGIFSGTEIAVVTSRRTRIRELRQRGDKRAELVSQLQRETDRFLATVQIGVTVAGAVASALSGALAVKLIKPYFQKITILSAYAETISLGIVVCVVSYMSLVLGELVPKALALKNPERFALSTARFIHWLQKLFTPLTRILTMSTNLVLKPVGTESFIERSFITEEEIKLLIKEGTDKGIFEPAEKELIHGVFEFTDRSVKEVMVPLTKVVAFSLDTPIKDVLKTMIEEQYSRYPLYHKEKSNIKGVLYIKDLFRKIVKKEEIDLRKLMRAPFFVPESMKISALLRQMQKKGVLIAIVVDEYGTVTGIATMEDLLEEIVGEIRDEYDFEQPVIRRSDGSFIVDASISIRDLKDDYGILLPESPDYDTVGGYIITRLQRIPSKGESFRSDGFRIKIIEMIGKRISKVILTPEESSRE